jgi:hypothetical protein
MLEDYYVKPSTIDRVRSSWLAPQIESYLTWLQAHGYSRLVVVSPVASVCSICRVRTEEGLQRCNCVDVAHVASVSLSFRTCCSKAVGRIDRYLIGTPGRLGLPLTSFFGLETWYAPCSL